MIKTLLVPLDGSRFAERALTVAVPIAERHGATLVLAMAHAIWSPSHGDPSAAFGGDLHLDVARDELRGQLERVARRVATRYHVTTATQFREGPIVEQLGAAVKETSSELIVMTSHGRGGVSRLWLGSVADALLRASDVPVLVMRNARPWTLTTEREPLFPRVLVALDGSRHAERALEDVLAVIGEEQCQIVLARVQEGPTAMVSDAWVKDTVREITREYLEPLAARHATPTRRFTCVAVVNVDPARALLALAREHNAFLIALATHGRTGARRVMLGSVADKLIRGTTIPVLVSPASRTHG
jgi:nucleotide-binding universal stress UspA family protein